MLQKMKEISLLVEITPPSLNKMYKNSTNIKFRIFDFSLDKLTKNSNAHLGAWYKSTVGLLTPHRIRSISADVFKHLRDYHCIKMSHNTYVESIKAARSQYLTRILYHHCVFFVQIITANIRC